MSYENKYPDWEQRIINAANTHQSATAAAASIGIKYDTYRKYAKKYGVFKTNPSGKGTKKNRPSIPLEEILSGLHPSYNSHRLKLRLIKEDIYPHKCNNCGITEWLGQITPLELEHRDGNCYNHNLENLELLCPNCHALTDTYRGKNINNGW